jgi:hypothetical protein
MPSGGRPYGFGEKSSRAAQPGDDLGDPVDIGTQVREAGWARRDLIDPDRGIDWDAADLALDLEARVG